MSRLWQKILVVLVFFTVFVAGGVLYFTGSFDQFPANSPLPQLRVDDRTGSMKDSSSLCFAVLGDMRWNSEPRQAILAAAQKEKPSFMVNLADVTTLARGAEWRTYISELKTGWDRDITYFHLPGGHSYNLRISGREPCFYSFYFGKSYYSRTNSNWLFLFLDTGRGYISEREYRFLRGELAVSGARRIIIFMHHPLFSPANGVTHALSESESEKFYAEIKSSNVAAIFTAHIHKTFEYRWHNIPVYVTSLNEKSWLSEPAYYRFVKLENKDFTVITRAVPR